MSDSDESENSDGSPVMDTPKPVAELSAFLSWRRIGAFGNVLPAQGVASLEEFANLVKDASLKKELRKCFIAEKTPKPEAQGEKKGSKSAPGNGSKLRAGHKLALKEFDALDATTIDENIDAFREERTPAPSETRYRATEELRRYLTQEGFPKESVPVFEEHGVYSIRSLEDLCKDAKRKGELEAELREGGVIGGKRFPASRSAADVLNKLSETDVATNSRPPKPPIQADTIMSEQAQARCKQIEEAIKKVEAIREACVGDASANLESMKERAQTELAAVLQGAGVDGELSRLNEGAFASLDTLNATLAGISRRLGDAVGKELLVTQVNAPLENDKLVEFNGLRRGMVLTVAGVRDACGAELVDVAASVSYSNEGYRESIAQYDSESSYQYAEKTVERSSSAFSTSERASGGGIGQSGLFALSAAGSYARARYEHKESTAGGRRSQASKLAVRKIEMVSARVRLPKAGVRLSREAAEAAMRIATEADESRSAQRARDFIDEFGSHLFCEIGLGGCYKSVVRAEALAEDRIGVLSRAVSLAAGWKASGAATYVGLNFLASAATANEGDKAQAEGFSKDERDQLKSVRIDISSHAVGGLPGLSADLWKYSLGKNQNWRVIDRHQPVALWTLLRDAIIDSLTDEQKGLLCRRLERSWVRDYFLPDLLALDADLKDNEALMKAESVAGLVEAVTGLMRPPSLRLCCFRKTLPASRTLRVALELPEHYKILSGGASTLKTDKGNFLISSYPSYDPALKRWAWHAEMRDIRHASSDEHEIAVIAVYDPDDEWDVRLFASQSQGLETRHSELVVAESGYLITGGGGRIDRFGWAALTQCGFEPGGTAAPEPGFRVASRSCLKDSHHQLTAIAVGLRPRNGTRLVPVYPGETGEQVAHPDIKLMRKNRGEVFLGGGVGTQPEGDNFLLGSCPIIDGSNEVAGWKASGKDHERTSKVGMTVTMVGVANVAFEYHVPQDKDKAQLREDSGQFCMECGHVGPWTSIDTWPQGFPNTLAPAQKQYIFQCANTKCRAFIKAGRA